MLSFWQVGLGLSALFPFPPSRHPLLCDPAPPSQLVLAPYPHNHPPSYLGPTPSPFRGLDNRVLEVQVNSRKVAVVL